MPTPASSSCSSVSWRCVVPAGYSAQLRASATCVAIEIILKWSSSAETLSRPPGTPKEITPQVPFGMYFWAVS